MALEKKFIVLKDFPPEAQREIQDLGVPDEYLFEKFSEDMQDAQEPFFSLILSQTTHEVPSTCHLMKV
ncbi:MAG: hypothetical protein R2772_09200 [Chitinophagales bacterium]